jgi:hypothetical protein
VPPQYSAASPERQQCQLSAFSVRRPLFDIKICSTQRPFTLNAGEKKKENSPFFGEYVNLSMIAVLDFLPA